MRNALRAATDAVHQRLHRQSAFAAIATGHIALPEYRQLLTRLLGFYGPLEFALGLCPERSVWLRADLRALGADAGFSVPLCPSLPRIDSRARRLGVRYVIEGAALGGQQLARRLDTLLGTGVEAGRRFFIGRGTATGAAWRAFLAELAACEADSTPRDAVITGACETFALFEWWLSGSSDL